MNAVDDDVVEVTGYENPYVECSAGHLVCEGSCNKPPRFVVGDHSADCQLGLEGSSDLSPLNESDH